ncbi:MAG: SRPBCC domain-containing protein [Pseudoxanthomonas sp.]
MADILHRVGIRASADQVYQALATPEGVAGWWTRDSRGDSTVGGNLRFVFSADGVELGSFRMKILALEPSRRVRWQVLEGPEEWIGTTIAFDLEQEDDYAIVLFKHQGWKEPVEFMHHCSTKWAVFLLSLKALLETGKGAPSPDDSKIDNWN